jgi:hypothetical protein
MEIATKDGAYTWQFGDQLWQQTADGHFSLKSVVGSNPPASLVDLDYLVGARAAPSSNQYLPGNFRFCPVSGMQLAATVYHPHNRWLPPYGDGSGSRVVADGQLDGAQSIVSRLFEQLQNDRASDLNGSKEIVQLPRKNGLNFFVADLGGYRDALFAVGRDGALFLWQRGSGKWLELHPEGVPIGRIRQENWAWSVSLCPSERGHTLLLASEEAAVLVKIDPLSLKYRSQRKDGRALAGPGDLEERSYLP